MFDAQTLYGCTPQAPSYGVAAPTQTMATDDLVTGWRGLVDPGNPLMWFGVVLAATIGLASVAGSVRLGRAKLTASLGQD